MPKCYNKHKVKKMVEQQDFVTPLLSEFNTKLQDLEEKQRLLKDRVLLIGENLISSKEENNKDITELKIKTEQIASDIERIKETLLRLSDELENKARRTEFELIRKQLKMFQPLEFARIDDVKRIIKEGR